uniref:Uncharacterized protein n=1 Tax=Anguilla anguilla TaxID=7936 RepID=A0A0E9QU65_ANGAN
MLTFRFTKKITVNPKNMLSQKDNLR